ncbi:hypothetical protein [Stenotrophomonas sp. 278]|uniref:hypothetical protein n=1 Tax=Stenotrophomonas sp. 278 TaxID=2479851 RepID=UPI000F6865B2|nr:hypothetical protein [Stenotrophomonas sp. 278]RRT99736.1 hypothetical protein EGJ34_20680 [Stenotrophomonas sp. 278]
MFTVETLRPLLRGACVLLPVLVLTACSSHKQAAKPTPPAVTDKVVELKLPELDGRGSYRFHMSNGEKRMSADEFDAWMKSNGIRVAKGNPQARPTPKPATQPVVVASKEDKKKKKK